MDRRPDPLGRSRRRWIASDFPHPVQTGLTPAPSEVGGKPPEGGLGGKSPPAGGSGRAARCPEEKHQRGDKPRKKAPTEVPPPPRPIRSI